MAFEINIITPGILINKTDIDAKLSGICEKLFNIR